MGVRKASLKDISKIMEIEKEYYEGFCNSEAVLKDWIESEDGNFLIFEVKKKIIGFMSKKYE